MRHFKKKYLSYLLKNIANPIVLALDEVNQLFEYKSLTRDVLVLLRSWHEETKDISVWQKKLRLAIAPSTEVYLPLPTNQSPFKEFLRSQAARTYKNLDEAITEAMMSVTLNDIIGWFKHCGYCTSLN